MVGLASIYGILLLVGLFLIIECVTRYFERKKQNLQEDALTIREEFLEVYATEKRNLVQQIRTLEDVILTKLENKKNLSELLITTATQDDYKEFVDALLPSLRDLYKSYQFQLLKPNPGDFVSGYALGFQLFRLEMEETYDYLFRLAIDKGMTEKGITLMFSEAVRNGELFDLGDVSIIDFGTGVSSILSGEDLRIYIAFATPEYMEKKAEAEAKAQADREELKAKQEEMLAKREEAYDTLEEATDVLSRMTEEALDKFPELDEQYNVVRDLYSKVQ